MSCTRCGTTPRIHQSPPLSPPKNEQSTRDALLKCIFLDDKGNVCMKWKKYMDPDAPWSDPKVFIPASVPVPDITKAPRAATGKFDVKALRAQIEEWHTIFTSHWTDTTTKDWDEVLNWLTGLYQDGCQECRAMRETYQALNRSLKNDDLSSKAKEDIRSEFNKLKQRKEEHLGQHAKDGTADVPRFHKFRYPYPDGHSGG